MKKERHQIIPAAYLVLFNGDKVLLLRRCHTGYEDGNYSLIAGHVEQGETFTQCVVREAKEEAGILLKNKDLRVAHVMHRKSNVDEGEERVDVFFITEKWDGLIDNKEPNKCDDLSWFSLDRLPVNVIPYIKQVLLGIQYKEFYSEQGW